MNNGNQHRYGRPDLRALRARLHLPRPGALRAGLRRGHRRQRRPRVPQRARRAGSQAQGAPHVRRHADRRLRGHPHHRLRLQLRRLAALGLRHPLPPAHHQDGRSPGDQGPPRGPVRPRRGPRPARPAHRRHLRLGRQPALHQRVLGLPDLRRRLGRPQAPQGHRRDARPPRGRGDHGDHPGEPGAHLPPVGRLPPPAHRLGLRR